MRLLCMCVIGSPSSVLSVARSLTLAVGLPSRELEVDDLTTEGLLPKAVGYALQLAVLCYLDTLLTSLVVDKMVQERDSSEETTNKAKELSAQGLANGVVAIFGGLPGAQATIRSVLILKEGGTMRLAGIAAGMHECLGLRVKERKLCMHPL